MAQVAHMPSEFFVVARSHDRQDSIDATILTPLTCHGYGVFDWTYNLWLRPETDVADAMERTTVLERAAAVWLDYPHEHLDALAFLAIGIAHTHTIPIFCLSEPPDKYLRKFVTVVDSIASALTLLRSELGPRRPALSSFQRYYRAVARLRGYSKESARDTLLLLIEEVGELARVIRKDENLVRHGHYPNDSTAAELADVFLYVVHLSNILEVDLGSAVEAKERINGHRFLKAQKRAGADHA